MIEAVLGVALCAVIVVLAVKLESTMARAIDAEDALSEVESRLDNMLELRRKDDELIVRQAAQIARLRDLNRIKWTSGPL